MNAIAVAAAILATASLGQVKLGVLPRLPPSEISKMMGSLAKHLEQAIGQPVQVVIPKDFDTFVQQAKAGEYDLAYSNPSVYAGLADAVGAEALAIGRETGTGKTYTGCFVVKEGGPKSLAELRGKRLIFVDEKSTGGYQVQMLALKKAGIGKGDFTMLPFAKKHTNVVLAVSNGTADAGGIRTVDLPRILEAQKTSGIKVLAETERVPTWPLFSLKKASKEVAAKAKAALLALPAGSPVLAPMGIDKFESAKESEFAIIRELQSL